MRLNRVIDTQNHWLPGRRLLFGLLAVLLLAGCAVNPVTGRNELALMQISPQEEIALGRQAYAQALQQMGGTYPDPGLNNYVDQVGQRLATHSHRPELAYRFSVVNDSTPNAFALPGGYIAITRGLLASLDNEAQLAAVLGHEIGHVTARHSLQGMQRGALLGATVGLLGGFAGQSGYGSLVDRIGGVTANLIDKRYSREQERESDRLGIDYMVGSGYAPAGAVQLQEFFYRQVEGGAQGDWLGGLFRSHPFSRERLLTNRSYIEQSYPGLTGSGDGLVETDFAIAMLPLRQTSEAYALYDRAQQQEQQGQLDEAIQTYHQALLKGGDQALIMTGLGLAYLQREDLVPARRYLIKAVNRQSDFYRSRLGLGYVYLQKQEYNKAVKQLERGLELLPTLQGAFLLGEAQQQLGERAKAGELYRAVVAADPDGKLGRIAGERLQRLEQRP